MAVKVIQIPTINDAAADFQKLFMLLSQVNGTKEDVQFGFDLCNFLGPNAVAFLGGVARLIEARSGSVCFDWSSLKSNKTLESLCNNGFAQTFGYESDMQRIDTIPYREDRLLDMNNIMDYLTLNWIGNGWVHVSPRLRDAIAGRMWENYSNAFEHSGTPVGVFSCGQLFRRHKNLILSVVDFGRGIPTNVRTFLRQYADESQVAQITDSTCLKWAFGRGNTTCMGGVARGLGLDLLKEFVRINQGKLEVYSNKGYAIIDHTGESFESRKREFGGTVMHITLRCDENLYRFRDEAEPSI